MDCESKHKAIRGAAWITGANWGCQLLSFCIYAALARLLSPHAFGLVALAWVYIAFIQIFVTQGFGMALIQRKDLEEEHLDSAFWIALTTALVFCLLSFLLAGRVAHFFKDPHLAPVIAWLSFTMLLSALSSVQSAILTRDLNFQPLAIRSLVATTVGGGVGVAMAILGFGVWSLVGQQLVAAVLGCTFLWIAVPWRPRLRVSTRHLSDLYGFSLSMTGNDILWFFAQKSDQTMVGYGFGAGALGPYSLASKVITLGYEAIVGPLQSVAFPTFSKLQMEAAQLESALHKFCELSSFLCLPLFAGAGVVAPELVPLLFGPKWLAAVPILQVLAFYGVMRVLLAVVHPVMLAKGRAGLYLSLNLILSGLTFGGCLIGTRWSPVAVAIAVVICNVLFFTIFLAVARRSLALSTIPLLKSFAYPGSCSLIMVAAISALRNSAMGHIPRGALLASSVSTGIVVYAAAAYLLQPQLVQTFCRTAIASLVSSRTGKTPPLQTLEGTNDTELQGASPASLETPQGICQ